MKRPTKPTPSSAAKRTLELATLTHVRGGDSGGESRNIEFEMIRQYRARG